MPKERRREKRPKKMFMSVPWECYGPCYPRVPDFLELIQEMMNEGELEFCGKMEEQNVSVLLKEKAPKPLIIYYRGGSQ